MNVVDDDDEDRVVLVAATVTAVTAGLAVPVAATQGEYRYAAAFAVIALVGALEVVYWTDLVGRGNA